MTSLDDWLRVELIRAKLAESGLSQTYFATLVGVSLEHLNQVLRGKAGASTDILDRWAAALGYEFVVGMRPLDRPQGE